MKKTKLLALTLVVAMMLVGAGYAIWTDSIVIDATVETGKFDMEFKSASLRSGKDEILNEVMGWHYYDWTDEGACTISEDKNSLEIELKDLYPGGRIKLDMHVRNNGDIPARLKSIQVTPISGSKLIEQLEAKYTYRGWITGTGVFTPEHPYDVDGNAWRSLEDSMNHIVWNMSQDDLVIEPNGEIHFGQEDEPGCIEFRLKPSAGNEFQDKTGKFRVTFNWEQWSTDPAANPYDGTNGYDGDGDVPGFKN